MKYKLRRHHTGAYRSNSRQAGKFWQFKAVASRWLLELRNTDTGDLIRFHGTWNTLAQANTEAWEVDRGD